MTKDSSAKRKAGKRKPEKLSFTQDFIPIKNLEHGIIETTDGRYIKILEIEPINFMLRSEEEQYEIICSFASWLKISPVHLQFKSITRKADSDKHMVEISVNGGDPIKNDLKYGMISGRKVDEDGHVIAGAIFGLFRNDENEYTAENAYLTAESAQDGTFKFEKVPFGTWVVREIQPAKGFVLNEKAYPVTVSEDGDVVSFQLENRYIRGNIEGTKLDEDGNVIAGAVFGLFRESETEFTEETAVRVTESDSNGTFRFEDIRYGKWIIRELKPTTGYVLNEMPIEVEITEDSKTVFITVENKFIRGDIKGYKVDEDGKSVAGALFGLFTEKDAEFTEENAVLTTVSDADGIFTFKNVRFGKWIVRELKPAEGFVLNETEFPVDITTDGAVIEIKAENRHIYGAVHTTKVDKDYPDHLLT